MSKEKLYRIVLSVKARADIKAIKKYTFKQYGEEQLKRYSGLIKEALEKISIMPTLGHFRKDLPEGIRAYRVGRHIVIYKIDGEMISILSVLHDSMDFPDQFQ